MVINPSMVKNWPNRAATKARRATGATPIRQAATKAQVPICGAISSIAQAAANSSPVRMTSLPLPVWYHALPRSAGSSWT